MRTYILEAETATDGAESLTRQLRAAIPDATTVRSIDDAVEGSQQADDPCSLLVISPPTDAESFRKLTDMASRCRGRLSFLVIGGEPSAEQYKTLLRVGAEWISAEADLKEIVDLLASRRPHDPVETATPVFASSRPTAIAFVPSAGGVGNTTLAVEVGVSLKTTKPTKGLETCIVDLDFQSSHVCDHLDIEPRLKMDEIASNPERLDAQLLDIFISRHASGLAVVAAPRRKADPCPANIAALDKLLDMIAARYQLILLDLPATWFDWTAQIVSVCDAAIVTGVNTIPGLRQIADTLSAVREAARPSAQIGVAVNRCQRRIWGGVARRHHADKVLGRKNIFYIAETPMALDSINIGTPMVLQSGAGSVRRDIAPLVRFCAELIHLAPTRITAPGPGSPARTG